MLFLFKILKLVLRKYIFKNFIELLMLFQKLLYIDIQKIIQFFCYGEMYVVVFYFVYNYVIGFSRNINWICLYEE